MNKLEQQIATAIRDRYKGFMAEYQDIDEMTEIAASIEAKLDSSVPQYIDVIIYTWLEEETDDGRCHNSYEEAIEEGLKQSLNLLK